MFLREIEPSDVGKLLRFTRIAPIPGEILFLTFSHEKILQAKQTTVVFDLDYFGQNGDEPKLSPGQNSKFQRAKSSV